LNEIVLKIKKIEEQIKNVFEIKKNVFEIKKIEEKTLFDRHKV